MLKLHSQRHTPSPLHPFATLQQCLHQLHSSIFSEHCMRLCFPKNGGSYCEREDDMWGSKEGILSTKMAPVYTQWWPCGARQYPHRNVGLQLYIEKPHLFRFAFFANIASDHLEAYILSGYNEGQFVQHGALSWISYSIYSTFMKVESDNKWQPYNLKSII